ncbi:MAG: phytanoyl-CoA dioxygenase family protein [Verrucomicrobia bacterium]|nr:phytanoyl-CoA dioxygenase family protein [Verrucomicrobiota bacterium]MDA1086828.1 phytanoyl-CoA dioxygenase family protein [Verrucomicrobiota bacterium]
MTVSTENVTLPQVSIGDIEVSADGLDIAKAAEIYKEYGCLVVRGLMKAHVEEMSREINMVIQESLDQVEQATKNALGWSTPNGTIWLPAPENFDREMQIMCLPISYKNSSAFTRAAMNPTTLDIVEAVLGPNLELFDTGQALVKEAVGGHPKVLHQDAAYFEHRFEGPMAQLNYVVDTDLNNGCLHVVPGSFKLGVLRHEDTFSHLGLDEKEWPWERSVPIEGKAGDAIFFHVKCIHGSKPNWSDKARPVYICRYRDADDYVIIGATTVESRAEAEKHIKKAKNENERNMMVRGFRKFDAARQQD